MSSRYIENLLPENWWEIIDTVDVEDLIALYVTEPDGYYQRLLDNPNTIQRLVETRIPNKYPDFLGEPSRHYPNNFREFVNLYDEFFASVRCENKYSIDRCVVNAANSGQLYWLMDYLEKDPSLATDALKVAAHNGDVQIGNYIVDNYDVEVRDIIMESVTMNHIGFTKLMLDNYDVPLAGMMEIISDILMIPELLDMIINYLDTEYPGWEQDDSNLHRLQWMVYGVTAKNGVEIGRKYANKYPQAIAGFYAGAAFYSLDDLKRETKELKDNPDRNKIMTDTLWLEIGTKNLENVKWINENFSIVDYEELVTRAYRNGSLEIFAYLLEYLPDDFDYFKLAKRIIKSGNNPVNMLKIVLRKVHFNEYQYIVLYNRVIELDYDENSSELLRVLYELSDVKFYLDLEMKKTLIRCVEMTDVHEDCKNNKLKTIIPVYLPRSYPFKTIIERYKEDREVIRLILDRVNNMNDFSGNLDSLFEYYCSEKKDFKIIAMIYKTRAISLRAISKVALELVRDESEYNLLIWILDKGAANFEEVMNEAIKYDNITAIKYMLSLDVDENIRELGESYMYSSRESYMYESR